MSFYTSPHYLKNTKSKGIIIFFLLVTSFLFLSDPSVIPIIFQSISDAYLQVSTFVAATLFLFFTIEKILKIDASEKLANAGNWQILFASFLGALPGCGGAIIIITRYVSGNLSFGSVLATLTATMGDAAFLLISQEPKTGLLIIFLGFFVGCITGYIVDFIHGKDFLRSSVDKSKINSNADEASDYKNPTLDAIWMFLMIPGLVLGLMLAFQIDIDEYFSFGNIKNAGTTFGFIGGILCLLMWTLPRVFKILPFNYPLGKSPIRRSISDTNFVTTWVILAFALYEVMVHVLGLDLKEFFSEFLLFTPLISLLIGFIPGCGPQILVTALYLSGYIPMSALISNAISNDGDALFPAIALAPKAALVATAYSGIPAVIVGYAWFFLIE